MIEGLLSFVLGFTIMYYLICYEPSFRRLILKDIAQQNINQVFTLKKRIKQKENELLEMMNQ